MAQLTPRKEEEFQTHLLTSKRRRLILVVLFLLSCSLFFFLIVRAMLAKHSWLSLLLPLLAIGIPLLISPQAQIWIYLPWQARARRNERTYLD